MQLAILFICLSTIMALIIGFIRRKDKFWFNYLALIGEILYFVYVVFRMQHYPSLQIAVIGTILLVVAFMGSINALKNKKISSTLQLGVTLSVYVYMLISLTVNASKRVYTSSDLDNNIISKFRKSGLPDSTKHFTIIHHKDSIH